MDLCRHAKSTSAQSALVATYQHTNKVCGFSTGLPMFIGVLAASVNDESMSRFATAFTLIAVVLSSGSSPAGSPESSSLAAVSSWQTPFDTPHRLARAYLQPTSDYSAGHRGVDYAVAFGERILAPRDGVVGFVGQIVDRPVLSLSHDGGFKTEFEPACSDLKVGEPVFAGQQIGLVCAGSADYSPHCQSDHCLHFSMRLNGKYLSPLALIGGLNPSRLLPYARG